MVNGVLVERTVEDVLPSLKTNSDGLKQVLDELLKQYKSKQSDLDNWKVRHFMPILVRRTRSDLDLPLQKKNNIQVVQP